MQDPKINEVATMLGITRYTVNKYIQIGLLERVYGAIPERITLESVQRLQREIEANNTDASLPLPCIGKAFFNPIMIVDFRMGFYKYRSNPEWLLTNGRYGVTRDGAVFNLISGVQLADNPTSHEYRQVCLTGINGRHIFVLTHRLVAFTWCSNSRFVSIAHHINGNRSDNSCDNLIWLSNDEHNKAHQLLREANDSKNWQRYNNYIRQRRKANAWTQQQLDRGICWVPGPFNSDNCTDIYYVDFDTYQRMQIEKKTIDEIDNPFIYMQYENPSPKNQTDKSTINGG